MNGVFFGEKHSFNDLNLLLATKEICPPRPKIHKVDVPLRNGSIDLTEALCDDVKYEDRKINLTFKIIEPIESWPRIISEVENYLHGQKMHIVFEDDIMHYYDGRVSVNKYASNRKVGTVVIECVVDPFKYDIGADWLWDPFNFDEDIITNDVSELNVDGSAELILTAKRKNTYPVFISDSRIKVDFKGQEYQLEIGKNRMYELLLDIGDNTLTFNGNAKIEVIYHGGSL